VSLFAARIEMPREHLMSPWTIQLEARLRERRM
jgi:hypothetical protein